jgi:hypothetical protein
MRFNTELKKLNDQDVLSFKNSDLKAIELRYALDQAFLGSVSDILMELLQDQDIEIDVGYYDKYGEWCQQKPQVWFQSGVECKVRKSGTAHWQTGKIKLQVSLEFCPDDAELLDFMEKLPVILERELAMSSSEHAYTSLVALQT